MRIQKGKHFHFKEYSVGKSGNHPEIVLEHLLYARPCPMHQKECTRQELFPLEPHAAEETRIREVGE